MISENVRPAAKIRYEKSTAVDLGLTARIVGASCAPGGGIGSDECDQVGNSATADCYDGNAASRDCDVGYSAVPDCTDGQGNVGG